MYLQTDEQTIDDLRLFGKRDSPGIFDLYNNTHTRGGSLLLQQLFRSPLSDQGEISRRSDIIARFSERRAVFPFDADQFDMAEKYLSNSNEQTGSGNRQTLSEKDVQQGVTAVIGLIQQVNRFVGDASVQQLAAFGKEREMIEGLLGDAAFEPVLAESSQGKLSYSATTAFDVLLRVRLREKIEKLLACIYTLDVYISVAQVAAKKQFIFPRALNKGTNVLEVKGLYHPELKSPVANDMTMKTGSNVVFLTGANMAGKSTFLRAVGTAVYIAHIGFPVAATDMEFSVMDGMYTTINLPDNLGMGASHFYAEVLRVKKVAAELQQGKSLFIIFDELFRGTNVKDAHEATVAITSAFATRHNSRFIISSHIVEAATELGRKPTVGFWFLPTRMNGHVPEYTYKLEEGVTNDRHGMVIIRNEGILDILQKGRKRVR